MPSAFGISVAAVVLLKNVDAGGGIPRAGLCGMLSKRYGLTLSQRGFAFSVHTSSLRREKKSSRSTPRFANSSDDFPTSIAPSVHLSGANERLNWIGTDVWYRVANQISLTGFCDFFLQDFVAIRTSNFARSELSG
ncbi:MAG: hypothetical protein WBX16_04815 [Candidatus Acidiferrales bacterium]